MTYFCFRLGLGAGLAAMGLYAAGFPDRPQQITRVVRADPRTGKLVRSVVVTARPVAPRPAAAAAVAERPMNNVAPAPVSADTPAFAPLPTDVDAIVEQIAAQHAVPALLIRSVIKVESNYNPFAVSSKGAMGLMQLMPETVRRFSVPDVFNPADNIEGGAKYLRFLLDLYNEDYRLALAAYNAGEKAIEKYGDVPPYPETQNYIYLVRREIGAAQRAAAVEAAAKPAAAQPVPTRPEEPKPAEVAHLYETVDSAGVVHYVSR